MLTVAVALSAASCDGDDDAREPPPPPPTTSTPAPKPPPSESRGVALSLDRDRARPGETLQLTVENGTRRRLEYGLAYRLERRTALGWRWVNRDAVFALILLGVEPGKREREEIRLPDELRPGRYRIVKSFRSPPTDRELDAFVEFVVADR